MSSNKYLYKRHIKNKSVQLLDNNPYQEQNDEDLSNPLLSVSFDNGYNPNA